VSPRIASRRRASGGRAGEGIGAGASGVQPGGVRRQWGTDVNCRLAGESFAFWREADERLGTGVSFGFRECGYLFVAHSQPTLDQLAENGVRPVGFAVIGTPRPKRSEYHYHAEPDSDSQDGQGQRQLLTEARRRLRSRT